MRWRRAKRLARLARERRPDGTLTPRAVRAWEELAAESVSWALQDAWLNDPCEDTWPYVEGWLTGRDVLAAAVDPSRSAESRAAIGAYCLRNDLLPEYPTDRVVFYLLTGDEERYRAADPDGRVLARAYRLAAERTREALRHSVVGAGDLDLVRVITERTAEEITSDEAAYLARQLATAGEWARLWRALPSMPLADAVRAARLFDGWQPDTEAGRVFLARLAATELETLAAPSAAAVTRIRTARVHEFSFAPDGREIAVRHERGTRVFTLPDGRLLGNYAGWEQQNILALGDGTIVYKGGTRDDYPLVRRAPGREPETLLPYGVGLRVCRTLDGFVVVQGRTAYFGASSGPWSRIDTVVLRGFKGSARMTLLAADAASGHLALQVHGRKSALVLVDAQFRVLASGAFHGLRDGAFSGPERIIVWNCYGSRSPELWRREGTALVKAASVDGAGYAPEVGPEMMVVSGSGLKWFDTDTFTRVSGPRGLPLTDWRKVVLSPDGSLLASAVERGVEVHDLWLHRLPELPGWRLSSAVPDDLTSVAQLEKRVLNPPAAEAVALLRAALEYRFGAEVALGDGTSAAGHATDIALGDG